MTDETASDRLASHYEKLRKALVEAVVDQLKRAVFNYQRDADLTEEEAGDDAAGMGELFEEIVARFLPALASQSPPLTDDVRVVSPDVAKWLESECNRYTNGKCTTRVCLRRGGWRDGAPDYSIATCEAHEARQALSAQLPPPADGGQA